MSARLVTWLVGALPVLSAAGAAGDEELERWVRALDAATEPGWTAAFEHLARLGRPASERVLTDFEAAPFAARRARAWLLLENPLPEHCTRVLALLDDPDPEVRRLLVLLLGNAALAETAQAERVSAFERLLTSDSSEFVRGKAREALVECGLDAAMGVLDRALEHLPAVEAERAATALAQLPAARTRLIKRLTEDGAWAPASGAGLPDGVRAALLSGYGRALAEVPGGGDERRERLPFLLGRTHPSPLVQVAARGALGAFVARAAELSEADRAERVLAALGEEGWPEVECLRRRLELAWLERGDAKSGLELARGLSRAANALPPDEAEDWELRGRIFEGAALTALGDRKAAGELFTALGTRLDASQARREDLFPHPGDGEWTEGGGATRIDRLHLAALVHLWRALLALDARAGEERVLEELRQVHVLFLESRLVALRTGAGDPSTLDSVFERDLSPHTLILFNEHLAPEQRGQALDRAVQLAEAFGRVAPLELPGLEGKEAARRELTDVFFDPERLELLKARREAHVRLLKRRLGEDDASGDPDLRLNQKRLLGAILQDLHQSENDERKALKEADPAQLSGARLRSIYAALLDYLTPAMHARTLAGELREEGRTREARELCERALRTLSTAPVGSSFWSELSSARFELLRGSTLMDEDRAAEAEQVYQGAERRLKAIETQMEERQASAGDPEAARQLEGQTRLIREMRGDALLSLAVNANVRMGKPDKALEYFERAYELNQSPFMRVLRACYRARSGKKDEARTVLKSVVPVPSLYYNIACTHALLGDKAEALDYLERDLAENHPTAGSLAQKIDWARKDPDLASLRREPRFERLLGGG